MKRRSKEKTPNELAVRIRSYDVLTDLPGVIDTETAVHGITETEFTRFEQTLTSVVKVATLAETGYICGHLCVINKPRQATQLKRIAVKPHFQGFGVGRALLHDAIRIARTGRRPKPLLVPVQETELELQLWLKHLGGYCFRWGDRDYDPGHDTYWFRF